MWNILRRVALTKQFTEGAAIRVEDFEVAHKQNMNLMAAMFEIRKWFIFNSPHKHYSERYTNDMAHLHNELNYQHARLLIRRGALIFALLYGYFWLVSEPDAIDWKDTFDIKMSERAYGTLTTSAGEGGASMDE